MAGGRLEIIPAGTPLPGRPPRLSVAGVLGTMSPPVRIHILMQTIDQSPRAANLYHLKFSARSAEK